MALRKLTHGRAAHLRTIARMERRLRPTLRQGLVSLAASVTPPEWTLAAATHIPPPGLAANLRARLAELQAALIRRLVIETVTEALLVSLREQTDPAELARLQIGALIREIEAEALAAVRLQLALIADAGITPGAIAALGATTGLTRRQVAQVERARRSALIAGASDVQAGATAGRLADRLIQRRATLIARTETVRFVGDVVQARGEAVAAAGGDVKRQWVSARDAHVDASDPGGPCRRNDDGQLRAMTEPFPSGHDQPPAHPGCRCLLELFVEEPAA